jgi:hypothetical protein
MVTRPAVLGPSIRIVKEGHAGEAGQTMRVESASPTLQEAPDVASILEIRPTVPRWGGLGDAVWCKTSGYTVNSSAGWGDLESTNKVLRTKNI